MKKTMKKIGAALLAAMMVMSVTGCSQGGNTAGTSAAGEGASGAGAEIAMIADGGSIDDQGFNQGTYEGVKQYGEEKGRQQMHICQPWNWQSKAEQKLL